MLQRAASNACSWWWANHIRTKQSKWLEQSLSDMEEKVQSMLKIIAEEGDSFAKRAEMYYKRRPELIEAVEDSFRAYKALADRYDMVSKELQNANNTIATVFPEQVQFAMDAEDDYNAPTPKPNKTTLQNIGSNVPKVPKASIDTLKGFINTASKQFQGKKLASKSIKPKPRPKPIAKLTMTKDEALQEINKVNKEILALQTVKEFCKSSYENGLAKFLELESQIVEMQERVSKLQDEYEVESVIEDSEARTLMAEAALKSCKETLTTLQEKQQQSNREAKDEFTRIEEARELLNSIRSENIDNDNEDGQEEAVEDDANSKSAEDRDSDDVTKLMQELSDMDTLTSDKNFDVSSQTALTVTQLAEKIDQLVNKVINLETAVSSQTVLINTLRTDSDDLHTRIKNLESEKETLIGDKRRLRNRIKELEDRLSRIEELNKNVEAHNNKLEANFAHAQCSLDHLSEKLSSVRPDEEGEDKKEGKSKKKKKKDKKDGESKSQKKSKDKTEDKTDDASLEEMTEQKDLPEEIKDEGPAPHDSELQKDQEDAPAAENEKQVDVSVQLPSIARHDEVSRPVRRSVTFSGETAKERIVSTHISHEDVKAQGEGSAGGESELSWQQMLLSGAEDRDKILLREYTTLLRNYKDVKKKLSETEKKDRDIQFDITLQMRQLKQAIIKRDQEIQHLRQELGNLQVNKDSKNEGDPLSNSSGGQSFKHESVDRGAKPESVDQSDKPEPADQSSVHESEKEISEVFQDSDVEEKEEDFNLMFQNKSSAVSAVEERLRMEIDVILDENLDFWLRFSTAFHQVQKVKNEVQDLMDEITTLRSKKKQEGCISAQLKSEVRPIYKHLREIQTELTMWLEQRASLKDELKQRFTSLCSIQEEITRSLKEGVEEDEIMFSTHQAAKLQGEILNMKQENNKVREELQTCLDHVSTLQLDIEKTLRQLNQEFSICSDQPQLQHTMSRSKVPLRSFIFGTKVKKQKSIFNFMHPNRKFHPVRPVPTG